MQPESSAQNSFERIEWLTVPLIGSIEWASQLPRRAKQAIVATLDIVMLVLATWTAYSLRMDEWALWPRPVQIMLFVTVLLAPTTFFITGVYRTIFRFAGVGMLATLAKAFIVYGGLVFVVFALIGIRDVPRTLGILQPLIFFVLVGGLRILIRFIVTDVMRRGQFGGSARRALIYGAGVAGQQLARSLQSEPGSTIVGFVDDDRRLMDQRLDGIQVFSSEGIADMVDRMAVDDVLLAMPGAGRRRRRKIVEDLASSDVTVRTLPRTRDIVDGKVSFDDIRQLEIEDLLGRDPVAPDGSLLTRTVLGKSVLVTGAGGSIGSELCRQIVAIGAKQLLLFEISEYSLYQIEKELRLAAEDRGCAIVPVLGSVRDAHKLSDTFDAHRIDTVFHAAAYKHVPLVEANPLEGIRNNVIGTYELVRAAHEASVSDFILISTDKAVRPTNVMGASKRGAEQVLQSFAQQNGNTRYSMVRFGNVLGSSGSVVPLFQRQIRAGGPITLTHRDVTRYFMTIPEAANLVIQAGGLAQGGEVFVLDMGRPVLIADLARAMVKLSGLTVRDDDRPEGDIELVEVGLRPGEKLYEELLIGNSPAETNHPRIMKASETFMQWSQLKLIVEELAQIRDRARALELLNQLVPEFDHCRDNPGRKRQAV